MASHHYNQDSEVGRRRTVVYIILAIALLTGVYIASTKYIDSLVDGSKFSKVNVTECQ